jgi:predicted DNA-binding protein (UPF0251 family)
MPRSVYFKPAGIPLRQMEERLLSIEGLEAMRLADKEGLSMDEASRRMGISRHTFGRILRRAHQTIAEVLTEGCALRVEGGHYRLMCGTEHQTEGTVKMQICKTSSVEKE